MTGSELAARSTESPANTGSGLIMRAPETPWMMRIEEHPSWAILQDLRITMRAVVPLHAFRVNDLLMLREGQVFETSSADTDDVSVLAGRVQVGWSEFEVTEQKMALRLTRLA